MTETGMTSETPTSTQDLIRPAAGRVLAGVAVGIADRLDIPTWVVRVVFVVLTISGGFGVLLYLGGWALIPAEGDARPASGRFIDRIEGPKAWVGVGFIALAFVVVVGSTGVLDGDLVVASVLILIGVLLYRGDIGSSAASSTPKEKQTNMTYPSTSVGDADLSDDLSTAVDAPEPPAPPPQPPTPSAPLPPRPPRPPRPRSILGRLTIAIALITLGVMGSIDTLGSATIDLRHYLGAAMTVIGVGLLVGSVFGRARGLIVLGVVMIPAVLLSPIGDLDFTSTNVDHAPAVVGDIDSDYQIDVGRLEIDLSNVDFTGSDITVDARVQMGELVVIVPDDVAVDAYGEVVVGEVEVLGRISAGIGEISARTTQEGSNGRLTIDARTDIGRVEIRRLADIRPLSGFGDRQFVIDSSSDLEDSYEVGAGELILDMSELILEIPRDVSIEVGTGTVIVYLPADIDSEVVAEVGIGDLSLPNGDRSGLGPDGSFSNGPDPLLSLDITVAAGEINVRESR